MAERRVGAAVVIDLEQPGPGILTERDILQSIGSGQDPDRERVGDHLSAQLTFAAPNWSLEAAAEAMVARRVPPPGRRRRRRDDWHPVDARHRALLGLRRRDQRAAVGSRYPGPGLVLQRNPEYVAAGVADPAPPPPRP